MALAERIDSIGAAGMRGVEDGLGAVAVGTDDDDGAATPSDWDRARGSQTFVGGGGILGDMGASAGSVAAVLDGRVADGWSRAVTSPSSFDRVGPAGFPSASDLSGLTPEEQSIAEALGVMEYGVGGGVGGGIPGREAPTEYMLGLTAKQSLSMMRTEALRRQAKLEGHDIGDGHSGTQGHMGASEDNHGHSIAAGNDGTGSIDSGLNDASTTRSTGSSSD